MAEVAGVTGLRYWKMLDLTEKSEAMPPVSRAAPSRRDAPSLPTRRFPA